MCDAGVVTRGLDDQSNTVQAGSAQVSDFTSLLLN